LVALRKIRPETQRNRKRKENGCVPVDCQTSKSIYQYVPIVHPQVAFHQGFKGDNDLVELGVEMTIPRDQIEYFLA